MNKIEEASDVAPPPAKKPYEKPLLSNRGSLRDLTMTKNVFSGSKDGKFLRFTGRGGHCVAVDRQA